MSTPDPADRTVFFRDGPAWVEFNARLNCTAEPKPRLAELLSGPSIWDEDGARS